MFADTFQLAVTVQKSIEAKESAGKRASVERGFFESRTHINKTPEETHGLRDASSDLMRVVIGNAVHGEAQVTKT